MIKSTALLLAAALFIFQVDPSSTLAHPSRLQPRLEERSAGSFNVLTFNVAGLPSFLNGNGEEGDKNANTRIIGEKFAAGDYDVIHVQEDFNYHAKLYQTASTATFPYRTSTSGGVPFGSGLNTLSKFPFSNFDRVKWDECSNASENDCFTRKGFTSMTVVLPGGLEVDFYNLHADAGVKGDDLKARADNLDQLARAITDRNPSGGGGGSRGGDRAVVVMGDTNSRYTRSGDVIPSFLEKTALTDSWVQLARTGGQPPRAGDSALVCTTTTSSSPKPPDNGCEVVDKIMYKSGGSVELEAVSWKYVGDRFLGQDGHPLSDHIPVLVTFNYRRV